MNLLKMFVKKDMLANNEIQVYTVESVLPAIHFENHRFLEELKNTLMLLVWLIKVKEKL